MCLGIFGSMVDKTSGVKMRETDIKENKKRKRNKHSKTQKQNKNNNICFNKAKNTNYNKTETNKNGCYSVSTFYILKSHCHYFENLISTDRNLLFSTLGFLYFVTK